MTVSPMRSAPIGPRAFWSDELGRRLRGFVDSLRPDVIHVDSVDLGLFEPVLRDHRKVLNHHNCESAMAWRRARTESNPVKKGYLGSQARKIEALERRVGGAFDVHTVVSAEDGALLHEVVPQAHVHVVENGTDLRYFHPSDSAPAPGTLIFAGSLSWYPNQSGLRYFLDEVWPIIREDAPESKLTVAGQRPPEWLRARLQQDGRITLVADPEDIRPYIWGASVFVCPIVDGGGTRLKLLDAFALGKAVVSTPIGCEGIPVTPGGEILVAGTPQEFASATIRVLADQALRDRLASSARVFVAERYGWDKIGRDLEAAYRCALGDRCALRPQAEPIVY
jgi:glycosyltransferase involved in cell wall biosynthesis